jgi:hypothetical protein
MLNDELDSASAGNGLEFTAKRSSTTGDELDTASAEKGSESGFRWTSSTTGDELDSASAGKGSESIGNETSVQ